MVPRCAAQWGSFKTDQEAPPSSHLMAAREPVAGLRCEVPSPWDPSLSHALLAELDQLNECIEDLVWTTIEDQIEPLSILRATVEAWRDSHSDSSWHAETAENMLRLLDPQVIAEHFPEDVVHARGDPYQVPTWSLPSALCFSLSGTTRSWQLEPPPQCASAAATQPVALTCPGLWAPLPVLLPWFRALGFECDGLGLRSPA